MKIIAPIRGTDQHGSGAFGASRGSRTHNGIDIACYKGSKIPCPVSGVVTKVGFPYDPTDKVKGYLRYIEVTDVGDNKHRFFYVDPKFKVGDKVSTKDIIGVTQGLAMMYLGITDHFHYEIINKEGKFINPSIWMENQS